MARKLASLIGGKRNSMREKLLLIILSLLLTIFIMPGLVMAQSAVPQRQEGRKIVVTIDDLPGGGFANGYDEAELKGMTLKILQAIRKHKIPALAVVNEGKLYRQGVLDESRAKLLRLWLDAGVELGNHTYSHRDINDTPLADYEADVIRGEKITRSLLGERGMRLRYFRHPFLHAGLDLNTKREFEKFLKARGYTVAPVTIDDDDYIFADVYARALQKNDRETLKRVAETYVPYMEKEFEFYEKMSRDLLGYELPQVLLIHANMLNADFLDQLAQMMKRRGYIFVSLAEALKDRAYAQPDDYAGRWGISWLERWARTKGLKFAPSPDPPDFIMRKYNEAAR
jgi:peptidoglycan/xylan/chitin deacetylase (PgdA/CDA1 family)